MLRNRPFAYDIILTTAATFTLLYYNRTPVFVRREWNVLNVRENSFRRDDVRGLLSYDHTHAHTRIIMIREMNNRPGDIDRRERVCATRARTTRVIILLS